ncbi:helix-turn-helix domain-containing protein [Sphaerisporangium album]|uniref:helix-turn-helix domain-containing protein n=1 Tax=Sphaerisporangium album TaxID=509200 RepID=UPI0011C03A94|nr:helix-turn-helix domain-containing protein [Sphaerisporangium album]
MLAELARLWDQAAHRAAATPPPRRHTQKELAEACGVPHTTVGSWATGHSVPRDLDQLVRIGAVLAGWAGERPATAAQWELLVRSDRRPRRDTGRQAASTDGPGRPLEQVSDPLALEVHRPIEATRPDAGTLSVLPPYVRRAHDQRLAEVVDRAAGGCSAMAVLVGGSSTGKTRACWEALTILRAQGGWRLWHPFDPTRPEAALAELATVGPRTVVWLNETQFYFDTAGDTGERVAAALRTLLTDPGRAPVLVLGTLWPQHWDTLTRQAPNPQTDSHAQARAVLAGTDIAMNAGFTDEQMRELRQAAAGDARLAEAVTHAADGEITQYLAGVPELLARYHNAPPPAKALIHAAMDARRLGHRLALPHALLAAAAPAYLSDAEWDAAGQDWLEQALAYTAKPCKGVRGPLTAIRPRPGTRSPKADPAARPVGARHTDTEQGPVYQLADYLDQHGRRHRHEHVPPAGFWAALAIGAHPGDLVALGNAACGRGLLRDAAQLYKNAVTRYGDIFAVSELITLLHRVHPSDRRPAQWVTMRTTPDNPRAVALLLSILPRVGAEEQADVLLARDPARHAAMNDHFGAGLLLQALWDSGAKDQVSLLLARDPARHAPLHDLIRVMLLLNSLRHVGAEEQVSVLADRAAHHAALEDLNGVALLLHVLPEEQVGVLLARNPAHRAPLDQPGGVEFLLSTLRKLGAEEQISVLLARDPARHAALDDPIGVTSLLNTLRDLGAEEQVSVLAIRATRHAIQAAPHSVTWMLNALRDVGAEEQVSVLLARDPARHIALDHPDGVAQLLDTLRGVGAEEQISVLLARDPARHTALDDLNGVARLLKVLWDAGAKEQVSVLLSRDPARRVALHDVGPYDTGALDTLLDTLDEAGALTQLSMLLARLPAAGRFGVFLGRQDNGVRFRFGRAPDGHPAQPWSWDDLA